MVAEHDEGFGQTASDVFLREVDDLGVGTSEVAGELVDEKPGQLDVFVDHILHEGHGECAHHRSLECGSG